LAKLLNLPCNVANSNRRRARQPGDAQAEGPGSESRAHPALGDRGIRGARLQGREHGRDRRAHAHHACADQLLLRQQGAEQLYIGVLEHVYSAIRAAEAELDLDHLDPMAAIRRVVEFTYNYYLANEGFVRLVVAENQARGRHLRKSQAMRKLNRPIIERLARVISRGQGVGLFRADVDPVEIHKAIAALGMFNVTNSYTFGAIFVGRRRAMVADMILSYLTRGGSP
jgi:hypothetical protein